MPHAQPFSFEERDHLVRIHLLLGLEDLGFEVVELGTEIAISTEPNPSSRSWSAVQEIR
jgi:hypothetical protein